MSEVIATTVSQFLSGAPEVQIRSPKLRGKHLTKEDTQMIKKLVADGWSDRQIAQALGIHHATVAKHSRK